VTARILSLRPGDSAMSHVPDELLVLYASLAAAGQDDDLGPAWTFARADAHVRGCRRCRREAEGWRRSLHRWKASDTLPGEPDAAFFDSLAAEIDGALGRAPAPRSRWPWAIAGVAAALVAAGLALAPAPRASVPLASAARAPLDDPLAEAARAAAVDLLADALADSPPPDWTPDLLAEPEDEAFAFATDLSDALDDLDPDALAALATRL